MIRLEIFVFLGVLIGIGLTLLCQFLWRKFSEAKERRVFEAARLAAVRVKIDDAPTDELLEELSTRNDLNTTRKSRV